MAMHNEIEMKLTLDQGILDRDIIELCEKLSVDEFETSQLINQYYDTPDMKLRKERIALRIRHANNQYIQTLKTAGTSNAGLHKRGEWEWVLEEPVLSSALLLSSGVWPNTIDPSTLLPIFETNFQRKQAIIHWGGSEIEWAIDEGVVLAGGKSSPISEIELELKKGEVHHVYEVEKVLVSILGTQLKRCDISKAQRGYRLLGINEPEKKM